MASSGEMVISFSLHFTIFHSSVVAHDCLLECGKVMPLCWCLSLFLLSLALPHIVHVHFSYSCFTCYVLYQSLLTSLLIHLLLARSLVDVSSHVHVQWMSVPMCMYYDPECSSLWSLDSLFFSGSRVPKELSQPQVRTTKAWEFDISLQLLKGLLGVWALDAHRDSLLIKIPFMGLFSCFIFHISSLMLCEICILSCGMLLRD